MRRGLLLLPGVLLALAFVSSATANKPIREPVTNPDGPPITGQCAFPVLAHIEGTEFDTTFFDRANDPIRLLGTFPGNTITLTNANTLESITLPATGTFQLRVGPDGSLAVTVTGHGAFFPNPLTDEPGIWYLSGRLHQTVDADGNTTSMTGSGTLVNLCSQLAS